MDAGQQRGYAMFSAGAEVKRVVQAVARVCRNVLRRRGGETMANVTHAVPNSCSPQARR